MPALKMEERGCELRDVRGFYKMGKAKIWVLRKPPKRLLFRPVGPISDF